MNQKTDVFAKIQKHLFFYEANTCAMCDGFYRRIDYEIFILCKINGKNNKKVSYTKLFV